MLCSSLYPQLAIGDEHNPYRKSNEIVFQVPGIATPIYAKYFAANSSFYIAKNFLSIHPSSVIASHPEWVQGYDKNTRKGKFHRLKFLYEYTNMPFYQMIKLWRIQCISSFYATCNYWKQTSHSW